MGRFYRPTVRTWLAARGTAAAPPEAPPGHLDDCTRVLERRCETPHHFFPSGSGSACACGRFAGALPGVCIQAPRPPCSNPRAHNLNGCECVKTS